MTLVIMLLVFLVLLFIGFPIAFALGVSSFTYLFSNSIPLIVIPQKVYTGMNSFVLLSIPGFLLAGSLMNYSGVTDRILNFSNTVIGFLKGGLALTNVLASMIFAGISGTAVGDTSMLGSILIPGMKKNGYSSEFSVGVTAASSIIGPIIPPSLPMIIMGTVSGLSVGRLFVAGIVPGVLLGIGMLVLVFLLAVRHNYPITPWKGLKELLFSFLKSFWALLLPPIILFGIVGGVFTPAEASIISVLYILLIGTVIYRKLSLKTILLSVVETGINTASLLMLTGFASLFAWILTIEQVPQLFANTILSITNNKLLVLLLINMILLIIGAFMETIAAILIMFPVLLKLVVSIGVDPIHFSMIMLVNLMIGLITPPLGVCLFISGRIGEINLAKAFKGVLPFLLLCLSILMLITYIPAISTLLPALIYNK